MTLTTYKWSIEEYHTYPTSNRYSQIKKYTSGKVSSLAFPQITIALEQLLLF